MTEEDHDLPFGLRNPAEVFEQIKRLSSDLTNEQHIIRSCILELHAAVEYELRRVYFHHFRTLLFLTHDNKQNSVTINEFNKKISKLGFIDMYRVLMPILNSWPYGDFNNIAKINEVRTLAAHGNISNVTYNGCNPFYDIRCLYKIYTDVIGIIDAMDKFFERAIVLPSARLREFHLRYGSIFPSDEAVEYFNTWYQRMTDSDDGGIA